MRSHCDCIFNKAPKRKTKSKYQRIHVSKLRYKKKKVFKTFGAICLNQTHTQTHRLKKKNVIKTCFIFILFNKITIILISFF